MIIGFGGVLLGVAGFLEIPICFCALLITQLFAIFHVKVET